MAIRTLDGRGMDQIAVTRDAYEAQNCTVQECKDPDQGNAKWYKSDLCNGAQMGRAALCAMDMIPHDEEAKMSMWSTGGNPKSIPQLIAYHHHWTDPLTSKSYAMHVIHTRSKANSPPYQECSLGPPGSTNGIGSIVIPCLPTKMLNDTMNDRFKRPSQARSPARGSTTSRRASRRRRPTHRRSAATQPAEARRLRRRRAPTPATTPR
ncbi:hypothetical protein PINS_up017636 [Pythium insidiosum]|nr:hypothetical protein PINS_up017636 [Pythium insidiosum]